MFGAGRPAKRPTIDRVRELTQSDLQGLVLGKTPSVKRFRDSHHMVARLFAMGLRPGEVREQTGYSSARISILQNDPAFQELIASYRDMVNDEFVESADEYFETVSANRRIAARLINDKLCEAEPEDVSFRELVLIHADSADRTGYPKRTVALNVNADFAALLDRAIDRSEKAKLIEARPNDPAELSVIEHQPTLRRRA